VASWTVSLTPDRPLLLFVVGVLDRPRDEDGLTFHTETIIWKSFSN
jgi:hypothetical protein